MTEMRNIYFLLLLFVLFSLSIARPLPQGGEGGPGQAGGGTGGPSQGGGSNNKGPGSGNDSSSVSNEDVSFDLPAAESPL